MSALSLASLRPLTHDKISSVSRSDQLIRQYTLSVKFVPCNGFVVKMFGEAATCEVIINLIEWVDAVANNATLKSLSITLSRKKVFSRWFYPLVWGVVVVRFRPKFPNPFTYGPSWSLNLVCSFSILVNRISNAFKLLVAFVGCWKTWLGLLRY